MRSLSSSLIIFTIMLLVDLYVYQAVRAVSQNYSPKSRLAITIVYWLFAVMGYVFVLFILPQSKNQNYNKNLRTYFFSIVVGLFLAKIVSVSFILLDDVRRIIQWIISKFSSKTVLGENTGAPITRSMFLSWLGLGTGATLFGSLLYGFTNKYNYQVKKIKLTFNNLPTSFKGLKIVHISDIHSGSFMDKQPVEKGIETINNLNADIILFTGDLVNDLAEEMKPFIDAFSKLKAPLGVYSTLGNHDYGDYVQWPDKTTEHKEKERIAGQKLFTPLQQKNLNELIETHARLGWKLLMDEHVELKKGEESISLLGVQNISGRKSFHSYGDLNKAKLQANNTHFKILMSHDPSHWEHEVQKHIDIDLMLSGHTHGMQFGIDIPGFKFSPVQWVYKHWAGLYENNNQKLYVNRGFGFIGYPGRVGILPEITLIELA